MGPDNITVFIRTSMWLEVDEQFDKQPVVNPQSNFRTNQIKETRLPK